MNKEGTLDDLYLEWLYKNFIGAITNRNPNSSYWELAKQMYTTRYAWVLRDDKHRGEDGKEIRREFIIDCDTQDIEVNWLQMECSVLEMLIGLARRAAFETNEEPGDWLWKFLRNMDLQSYNDRIYTPIVMEEVDAIIQRLLDRAYDKNGVGGLFPLAHAIRDQTQVNIWYQLQAYLLEGNGLQDAS